LILVRQIASNSIAGVCFVNEHIHQLKPSLLVYLSSGSIGAITITVFDIMSATTTKNSEKHQE
jgi:hypothetical protein